MSFRAHLLAACVVLVAAIWLSSGTMAPYASTWSSPAVSAPCHYLYNVDHPQFRATFAMLDGAPRNEWGFSVVLRRILFPLVAYPFMKLLDFERGGFLTSVLAHLAALLALGLSLRRREGERAAILGVWLLATWPGVTYWAALPYSYSAIVPASVGLYLLLARLANETSLRRAALLASGMGVLFTAYDFLPIFGVAAVMTLAVARRWRVLAVTVPCLLLPTVVSLLALRLVWHASTNNSNTAIYSTVMGAYLHPPALGVWLSALRDLPSVTLANFLFSTFLFLPLLFLALLPFGTRTTHAERAILLATALIFLFNNLAPPYVSRWQMRGLFIARLYQPVFVVFLFYAARAATTRLPVVLCIVAIAANLTIAFGPIARVPWAGYVYHRFYMHAQANTMELNLDRWGRRPMGFCGGR